jgi:SNF family Na+-dependent transporter
MSESTPALAGPDAAMVDPSAPDPKEKGGRGNWSSRIAFYMASIGAAIGFGNVWRFPSLCVDYGGGAFFVPYLMALFILGIPLVILEIGFGQYFQTGDIGVFGSFHPRLRGVG